MLLSAVNLLAAKFWLLTVEAGDLRLPGADGRVISGWFATFNVYLLMLAERCKAVGLAMRRDSLGGRRPFLRERDCLIRV